MLKSQMIDSRDNTVTGSAPAVVDLFCGAGGMSLGFQRAGFHLLRAFDNWEPAVLTHHTNLGDHVHKAFITGDLDVPDAAVITGGPPCQGFSSAGMRRSDDRRNTLVGEYSRLIARKRPLAFVFENVEGFLTSGDGAFVFELLDPLIAAGYRIHLRKVNAANFGVPQHRKRVVAIGGLGWDPTFPEATHAAFGAPGVHRANGRALTRTPTLAEALASLPSASSSGEPLVLDHGFEALVGEDLQRAQLLLPGQMMRDLPEELWHESYRRRAFRRVMDGTPTERRGGAPAGIRRLKPDEPSKAITGGALGEFLHPTEDRPLTIRECATLQTFPSDFRFAGTDTEKIQLIGNAVPPLFAEAIARNLIRELAGAVPREDRGALLSFVPTSSPGMSPALERVVRQVESRYGSPCEQQSFDLVWR
jgi:DNA (cytosine-5)-methyltransferase 1